MQMKKLNTQRDKDGLFDPKLVNKHQSPANVFEIREKREKAIN
jgi:hypothetical protein